MSENWDETDVSHSQSVENLDPEKFYIEPIYEAFLCPLTKQAMKDPVTLENGQTFERTAIENWFKECKRRGKIPYCPITMQELRSTDLNPSIALRNTIEEWIARNEAARLDLAGKVLVPENSEVAIVQGLQYLQNICQSKTSNKCSIRETKLIPKVVDLLKNSNGKVRCLALQTLCIVVKDDDENKEAMTEGDTVRTIVKFISNGHPEEREEAMSLLYELSKSRRICEKIGDVNGAIVLLLGMTSSKSQNVSIVEKADKLLENMEVCESNILQMAKIGRLQPLLTLLLEGSHPTKISMIAYLGELSLNNDQKVCVASTVGLTLIDAMKSNRIETREIALKALNNISSCDASAKILIEAGILPSLVKELFKVGNNQLPMKLKEVSATILANLVNSDCNFESIPLGSDNHTLVSEDIVHSLLHLISNTGPDIECKLLQVLVGLTGSSLCVMNVVSAIRSSGAIVTLIQFIEAQQKDLRIASLKLLQQLSPHMGEDLAEALQATAGQLRCLVKLLEEYSISEEQIAAVGLLADLPERDHGLTHQLIKEQAFETVIYNISKIRHGETRSNRFTTPYLEGLVRVLSRLTFALSNDEEAVHFARVNDLAARFIELLQSNGLDKVQEVSAIALENLSYESPRLTKQIKSPKPGLFGLIIPCLQKRTGMDNLCPLHHGVCTLRDSFCLLQGRAVEKLIECLDHSNVKVVEAALAALYTLLDDSVDISEGVLVLERCGGINPIMNILLENRTPILLQRSVRALERILRNGDIACMIAREQTVSTALVDAYRNGDFMTRQIAEMALVHVDRIPNFSSIFTKVGG